METPGREQRRRPLDTADVRRVGCKLLLAHELIVIRMTSGSRTIALHPAPQAPRPGRGDLHAPRNTAPHACNAARDDGVLLEQQEVLIRKATDRWRQGMITGPEGRRGVMIQSGVVCPAW